MVNRLSGVNVYSWHFVLENDEENKAHIAKATADYTLFNIYKAACTFIIQ